MLIITQRWYEGKRRVLIVVPTPLLHQWQKIIDSRYSVPLYSIDNNTVFQEQINNGNANPFEQDGVVITTYDFAAEKADFISQILWDLTTFEEAHHLRRIYTGEDKSASAIREAVSGSFKLLLTATPMQNDIMDLYGLIYFIDENALPEADSFYKRYFRKPENYVELASRVSKYCFRTTRPQVATYVKIPERLPLTFNYTPSDKERQLADMLDTYLARNKKLTFPKTELYDLTLMLFRTLSSSTFALTCYYCCVCLFLLWLQSNQSARVAQVTSEQVKQVTADMKYGDIIDLLGNTVDIGSGIYILQYEIDGKYTLDISFISHDTPCGYSGDELLAMMQPKT